MSFTFRPCLKMLEDGEREEEEEEEEEKEDEEKEEEEGVQKQSGNIENPLEGSQARIV